MKKVGVSKEEKQLSYYKFFERDLAEVPQEKLDILNKGASKIPMNRYVWHQNKQKGMTHEGEAVQKNTSISADDMCCHSFRMCGAGT